MPCQYELLSSSSPILDIPPSSSSELEEEESCGLGPDWLGESQKSAEKLNAGWLALETLDVSAAMTG